jgi:hypothetical protein
LDEESGGESDHDGDDDDDDDDGDDDDGDPGDMPDFSKGLVMGTYHDPVPVMHHSPGASYMTFTIGRMDSHRTTCTWSERTKSTQLLMFNN